MNDLFIHSWSEKLGKELIEYWKYTGFLDIFPQLSPTQVGETLSFFYDSFFVFPKIPWVVQKKSEFIQRMKDFYTIPWFYLILS